MPRRLHDMNGTLIALDPVIADQLRAAGGIVYVADEHPGFPCRQCLRDADVGDELILVSYDPFTADSPYRSASPIFLHRHPCGEPGRADEPVPEQLRRRRLSVRAFDTGEMMIDAAFTEGADLASTIDRLLTNADVDHLHIHNEPRGCFAAKVLRPH